MDSQIISTLISAVPPIIAAVISGWVAIKIANMKLRAEGKKPTQHRRQVDWLWGIIGAIIGGGLVVGIILLRNPPPPPPISTPKATPTAIVTPTPTFTPKPIPKPTEESRPTPTVGAGNAENDCTSITAYGYDVLFSPVDLVGIYKDWRKWGWVELALKYARQEKASEVFAYEVYEANKVKKTDEYYATWRFEVEGTILNYRYLPGTPTIEVGSCWKQFEGKIPNNLLSLGTSKIVIHVLKQK